MAIKTTNLKNLEVGFSAAFQRGFQNTVSFKDQLATTIPSSHSIEVYGFLAAIESMREWLGPRVIRDLETKEYTLTNKEWELTVGVKRTDIEDDNLGVYTPRFEMMGYNGRKLPDQRLKVAIQAGTSNTTFDGLSFFNTAHTLNPAGTQSNNFTTTALSATNYDVVRSAMQAYTDANGESLGVTPNLLVVPPQLEKTARDIVVAQYGTSGATNTLAGTANVLVLPELSNQATTWYLMDTTRPIKPFIWQERMPVEMEAFDSPSDYSVFKNGRYEYGLRARGEAGYGLWFLAARAIA